MSEQALDAHVDYQEQRPPEEMVMVEKSYLVWVGQKIAQLEAEIAELKRGMEQNLRAAQHAEAKLGKYEDNEREYQEFVQNITT